MKLIDIINEDENPAFKTTKVSTDPTTGQITWDVEYTPLFKVDDELGKLQDDMGRAIQKYPEDQKLAEFDAAFRSFKKAFRRYIYRRYGRDL